MGSQDGMDGPLEPMMLASEVARLTKLALPTVYEKARTEPKRWGAVRLGRAVRFRRKAIEQLLSGEGT